MIRPTAETLAGIELFQGLKAEQRTNLAARCRARQYDPDDQIVLRLTESKDVFFIVSGKVRVTMYSRSGKEVSFRDLGPGKMFGELSAIDDKPRSVDVMALTDAFILSM